jgi:hypothetical protein
MNRGTARAKSCKLTLWVFGAVLLTASAACEEKAKPATAEPAPAPPPAKPKAPLGSSCQSNDDCGEGLGCAEDKTCQSYKTIECRGRDAACKREGRCSGSERGCTAASNADCQQAEVCAQEGRCTAQEGRCVAATTEDCKKVCELQGHCTVQDGKCLAASNADCKQSDECKSYDKCIAKKGICVKKG